ncbi:MAG TPA: hypothetical protein PKG77_16435, partial [Phycisphaerae bacterium]|nr:hypothetical protein [Phycisphaerae bacterium]
VVYFASNDDADIERIVLAGTTQRSMLLVSGRTSMNGLDCPDPLGRVVAQTTNLSGTVTIGPATSATATTMLLFANVADANIQSAMPISTFLASSWLDSDAAPDTLTAPWAGTIMCRGDFAADVNLTGADARGNSVNVFYAMGDVVGSVLNLAAAAGVIYARSWTGGSIQALYVGSLLTTRGAFGADVNLTGANAAGNSLNLLSSAGTVSSASIVLAGGAGSIIAPAWAVGQFTAQNVSMFMSRGDFTGNVTLTGQNRAGSSLNVLYVMGEMNAGLVRTRGGIGTAMIGSMRDSGVYACVLDGVAGMPGAGVTAAEYFAAPLAGMQTPAIRMLMISRAAGVFANSVVAGPSMGTVILRGVATDNGDAAFGLVADTGITMLTRYRDGAAPSTARNVVAGLTDTLPAEDDFTVQIL